MSPPWNSSEVSSMVLTSKVLVGVDQDGVTPANTKRGAMERRVIEIIFFILSFPLVELVLSCDNQVIAQTGKLITGFCKKFKNPVP